MVMDGNYIFCGEHAVRYIEVEIKCTRETYDDIKQCYFNEK